MSAQTKKQMIRRADLCGMAALGYPVVLNMARALFSLGIAWKIPGASLANPVGISQTTAILLNLLAGGLALVIPGVLAARAGRLSPREMYWRSAPAGSLRRWLPLFLGMASLANLLAGLIGKVLRAPASRTQLPAGGWELVLAFAALCLLPALGEELFFRGVLQGLLRPAGESTAIWATALLFGLLHGSLAGCINAFLCGLVLSSCAQATGSLVPGMVLHFTNNVLAFLGLYLTQYGSAQFYQLMLLVLPLGAAVISLLRHPLDIHRPKHTENYLNQSQGYRLAVLSLTAFCLLRSFVLL